MRDEIISFDTGRDVYGLVMDPLTFALDEAATQSRRAKLEAERGEVTQIQPTSPSSSTWLEENMREGDNYLLDPLP